MNTSFQSSSSSAAEPPVDFDQLRAAAGDDPNFMRELAGLYFGQAAEIMPALAAALQKGVAQDVNYLAHRLAGASLSCGMSAMVGPLRELEKLGREGDLAEAGVSLTQAAANLEKVGTAVRDYLRRTEIA